MKGGPPNHNMNVSYMDEMSRHKLITGLADQDIFQDVLAADKKSLFATISFVEGKEGGKSAVPCWGRNCD